MKHLVYLEAFFTPKVTYIHSIKKLFVSVIAIGLSERQKLINEMYICDVTLEVNISIKMGREVTFFLHI